MVDSERSQPDSSTTDRLTRWLLLGGNRLAVSGVIVAVIFITFLIFGLAGIVTISKPDRMLWFLNGTINGLLTLIPIAVGINQIVLSQELGSMNNLYSRVENTLDFRQRVENTTGVDVSSPQSAEFFHDLFVALNDRADALGDASNGDIDQQLNDEIDDYAETLSQQTNHASSILENMDFEIIDTFLVLLDYHDSEQFHRVRRLQNEHTDELSDETSDRLGEIQELFMELDAARQYLKTLFIQRELSELSRVLIYTGIPAILLAGLAIFTYRDMPGLSIPRPLIVVLVSATVAASLAPLAILSAYIVRVALIAQRTAAFGPFIPHEEHQRIIEQNE
ncbi:hypothetical protein [Haladaptatus halobius]|uniref:hypothetical protein n=1 Tax=Haladaptatus halobius TaxID=2884875 RepID=UPI001D0B6A1D|nr:hypothetical protein [Haladaptatus halobius]